VAEPEEWTRIIENPFEGSQLVGGDFTHVVTQVVDAATGAPIPGATLSIAAVDRHLPPALPNVFARAVVDEFGIARVPHDPGSGGWFLIEAPGYAPHAVWRVESFPVRLMCGEDVRLRIYDALGDSAPGVQAQYYYGAGGGPNYREPFTDANGDVTLRCIDLGEGLLFPVGPGVSGGDVDPAKIPPFGGVRHVYGEPGVVVRGRVFDEQGRPVSGACVGATCWNHGPWTRTNAAGSFRLVGVPEFDDVRVYRTPDADEPLAMFEVPPAGVPVTVRAGTDEEPVFRVRVHLAIPDEPDLRAADVVVCAWRAADGSCVRGTTSGAWGGVYLDMPAGRWTVRVGGGVSPCIEKRLEIDIAPREGNRIDVPVEFWPEMQVDLPRLDAGWGVVLASRGAQRWLSDTEVRSGAVRLPRDRDLALRIVGVSEPAAGYPGCIVRIPRGKTPAGKLARPPERAEWNVFPLLLRGGVDVEEAENEGWLTVLDPDGEPVAGAAVHRYTRNSFEMRYTDEQGRAPGGPAGALVEVRADRDVGYWAPLRMQFEGRGPWKLQFRGTSVRLEVRDEGGQAIPWWGLFPDGDTAWGVDHDVELFGMGPGLYRVLACAPGRRGVVTQFRIVEGEPCRVRVVLPRADRG